MTLAYLCDLGGDIDVPVDFLVHKLARCQSGNCCQEQQHSHANDSVVYLLINTRYCIQHIITKGFFVNCN